ncbi:MAG: hypothetical protein Kow0092_00110 [Deferrisomatales bacterium]
MNERELQQAIVLFEQTTAKLRDSYERLQQEVRELKDKLAAKDRELGDSLAERDRLAVYLEHLLESVPSGVVAVDPGGRITTINRAAQEITGLGPDAVGEPFERVMPLTARDGGAAGGLEALERASRWEVTLRRPDGETALLGLRVSPLRGEDRQTRGRVVVFQDVTRLKRLEAQQARNRRLVAMGEMAAGIAHEIRNPLGSLELFASHLVEELRGGAHEDLAAQVLKGIRDVSRITGNLLLFARKVEPRPVEADLGEVLGEALLYARSAATAKGVSVDARRGSAPVRADPDLMRQVFLNLLLNAVQAVSEGGRIAAEAGVDRHEDPPAAVVTVWDDGPGVAPEVAERIFDPFFTTRAGGIGLGLAIVQRIVSAHGGWVAVERGPWGGAAFRVGLPLTDQGGSARE